MKKDASGVSRIAEAACLAALVGLCVTSAGWAQTTTSWPSPESYLNKNFDGSDTVKVTGEVAGVETIEGAVIIWVNAKRVEKAGFGSRPGMEVAGGDMLWRVEGPGVAKLKNAASVAAGAKITISGDNWVDKSCKPSCRIRADRVSVK